MIIKLELSSHCRQNMLICYRQQMAIIEHFVSPCQFNLILPVKRYHLKKKFCAIHDIVLTTSLLEYVNFSILLLCPTTK